MKPTFALDLSRETIALLRRTPKGWLNLGEVAFDAPDMAETLDHFRKTALGLSPFGLACKVILPNDQVLYTEIHAPGPSREDKRGQIAKALEGRTPYAVEDLVFDWSGKGSQLRVAVVARQTLEEAEAFATEHRLNPVSFVAIPATGTFFGEAWFGPTSCADSVLAPGETVERDREAVTVVGRDPDVLPPPPAPARSGEPLAADPTPAPENQEGPPKFEWDEPQTGADATPAEVGHRAQTEPDNPAEPAQAAPIPGFAGEKPAEPTKPADPDEAPFTEVTDEGDPAPERPQPKPPVGEARVVASEILDDDVPPAPSPAAMFAFSSRRKVDTNYSPPPPPPPRTPAALNGRGANGGAQSSGNSLGASSALPAKRVMINTPSAPGTRAKAKVKPGQGNLAQPNPYNSPKSPARPMGTFSMPPPRRGRTGFILMVMVALLLVGLALVAAWASYFLTQAAETSVGAEPVAVAEAPAIEDEMAADLQDPETLANEELATATPAEDTYAGGEEAGADAGQDVLAQDSTPAAADEQAQTLTDPEGTGDVAEAASVSDTAGETDAAPANTANSVGAAPPGTAIATEVSGTRRPVEDQDEIFLASMDAPPSVQDALALPALANTTDAPPAAPMSPPVFGTVYRFDAQGLLMPTPEGILSPDGITLVAGQPPLLPPARSPAAEAAATAAAAVAPPAATPTAAMPTETTPAANASLVTGTANSTLDTPEIGAETPVEPVASDPAMASFRPKPRPETLTTTDDGATLDAQPVTDVVTLRPLGRPASVTSAAAAANPTPTPTTDTAMSDLGAQAASLTAQAGARVAAAQALEAANPSIVAISMRPAARPNDLSRAVEAAVAAAVLEPAPEPEPDGQLVAALPQGSSEEHAEIDEPEVEGTAPAIPTRASVAKQATYNNAINLSKINLIGTFGTSSRPYALIRQANGKYKKITIGDKIDGGVVKAITENEVRYQKGGKLLSLKLPKA